MDLANLALSFAPLVLFEAHAPTALVVVVTVVWTVGFAIALPAMVRSMHECWRAGTRAKWQARILRAHTAELRELTAELHEEPR